MTSLNQEEKLSKFIAKEGFTQAVTRWIYEINSSELDTSLIDDILSLKIGDVLQLTYIK